MQAALEPHPRWCTQCRASFRTDFARCPVDGAVIEESATDPLLGMMFGHYVIDSFLGEGGMSRVYRAHHSLLEHKQFALKVMMGEFAATLEMRMRFAQEADAASQLDHPNVVSVVDFGKTDGGLMFIAMDLVSGRSLATLISEEAPIAPKRAISLTRQIALGLSHAHGRGLVHRDLKPDNIIVTNAPEVARIVDFGLAIPVDDERSTRLTSVGFAVGTPIYAAPEQTHNAPVDHRADLFALGVTLYEMLAGIPPFAGGTADLIRLNASDIFPPFTARSGVEVPPVVEAIVRKLMRNDPAARYATAADLIDALDEQAADATVQMAAVSLAAAPQRRSALRWAVPLAILAVGAIAIAAVVATRAPAPVARPVEPVVAAVQPPPPKPAPVATPEPATPEIVAPVTPDPKPATGSAPAPKPAPKQRPAITTQPTKPATEATISTKPPETGAVPPPEQPVEKVPVPAPTPVPDKPSPAPIPLPRPLWTSATVGIAALRVRGSLTDADVRRAIERGLPAMRACYQRTARDAKKSPAATARITLAFDDSRRATNVAAVAPSFPALASCVRAAAEELRVQIAPDVGTVDVVVDLAFTPVAP
ncbi:MAG: protein kinase [Kofleriaceae bacterium]